MPSSGRVFVIGLLLASGAGAVAQNPQQIVQQAVKTELAADAADHSHWLYLDMDRKPGTDVKEWVAETTNGDMKRILNENGRGLSEQEQRSKMDAFARDQASQAKQHKTGQHDDEQARQMLEMLPQAFVWTEGETRDGKIELRFTPNPRFRPPNREARVFAAMKGEMTVDENEHRIASLKGRMIRDVTFGGGLLGYLKAGGSFDVERRPLKPGIWQITETHVHIAGRALLFKTISEQEDETKSKFQELAADLKFSDAEQLLLKQGA